ncbi:MAG: hypothetical protein DMF88_07705, partial [Acidobacteria bacterium]
MAADNSIVDQVGLSPGSAYKEGTPLASRGTANLNQGYERKLGGADGSSQDTNNNSADFQLKAPSDPQNLASAITPSIAVSPTSLNFGSLPAGASSVATVTVTNIAAAAVTLTPPFTPAGSNAGDFTIGMPAASSLAAGASTTFQVTFTPASAGPKAASVKVTSSGGGVVVPLSGSATPGITVDPTSIDFGSLDTGTSATSFVTITNSESSPVTLATPFNISGANAGDFSVGVPGTTALAGGESTSVAVGFLPDAAGGKFATLAIASTAGSVRTVSLAGSSACPAITINGNLTAGILNTPYSRTITASGGVSPYSFSISAGAVPTGLTLSTGGVLSGSPTAAATFNFTVQAADALGCAGSASYSVPILAAQVTATPNPVDFGAVPNGSPASRTVTITNNSGFTVTLGTPFPITGTGSAQFSAGLPATATLAAGASSTADVTFTPTSFGAKTATLNITSTAGGSTSLTLNGSGLNVSVGHTVLISEFRFRGPNGASDEFVEIYNNTDLPIDISGYTLRGSNNAGPVGVRATVAGGTMLPTHGHFLFTNSTATTGYSGS